MKVGKSVHKAIQDWQGGDDESAMLHACNAVDGTSKKMYPSLGVKARFTRILREGYALLGPMGAPGINIAETLFPIRRNASAKLAFVDIAELIYAIHRCSHGHGEELPDGYALLRDAAGPPRQTRIRIERGKVMLSDRVIFGLLAVAVTCPANSNERTHDGYYLTFDGGPPMEINLWWGRYRDMASLVEGVELPSVTLNFQNWQEE